MGFAICNSLVSKAWQVKKYDRRNPRPLNELGSHNERCEAAEETVRMLRRDSVTAVWSPARRYLCRPHERSATSRSSTRCAGACLPPSPDASAYRIVRYISIASPRSVRALSRSSSACRSINIAAYQRLTSGWAILSGISCAWRRADSKCSWAVSHCSPAAAANVGSPGTGRCARRSRQSRGMSAWPEYALTTSSAAHDQSVNVAYVQVSDRWPNRTVIPVDGCDPVCRIRKLCTWILVRISAY